MYDGNKHLVVTYDRDWIEHEPEEEFGDSSASREKVDILTEKNSRLSSVPEAQGQC